MSVYCRARSGATRCHAICVCGNPCNSRSGGPLPPMRRKTSASPVETRLSEKPSNITPHPPIAGAMGPSLSHKGRGKLRAVLADDGDRADVLVREAAEIVDEAAHRLLAALALAGAPLHLQIDLVDHAQARGADRVAEAFEAAIDLARHLALGIVEAVEHVLDRAALGRDEEILHGHQLGDREAV